MLHGKFLSQLIQSLAADSCIITLRYACTHFKYLHAINPQAVNNNNKMDFWPRIWMGITLKSLQFLSLLQMQVCQNSVYTGLSWLFPSSVSWQQYACSLFFPSKAARQPLSLQGSNRVKRAKQRPEIHQPAVSSTQGPRKEGTVCALCCIQARTFSTWASAQRRPDGPAYTISCALHMSSHTFHETLHACISTVPLMAPKFHSHYRIQLVA